MKCVDQALPRALRGMDAELDLHRFTFLDFYLYSFPSIDRPCRLNLQKEEVGAGRSANLKRAVRVNFVVKQAC